MLQQESIYNLIPAKKIIPDRPAHHISCYPPDIPPTASTFILRGSSLPGISNCNVDFRLPRGGHSTVKNSATFGLPIGGCTRSKKLSQKRANFQNITTS